MNKYIMHYNHFYFTDPVCLEINETKRFYNAEPKTAIYETRLSFLIQIIYLL